MEAEGKDIIQPHHSKTSILMNIRGAKVEERTIISPGAVTIEALVLRN